MEAGAITTRQDEILPGVALLLEPVATCWIIAGNCFVFQKWHEEIV